jgi:spore coat polysaccharide biosynthesis protein SpsF
MGSSRLPGKVLLDIAGQPMLARVIERVRRANTVDEVLVATTVDPSDDPIVAFCQQRGVAFYRGSVYDVLDRFYGAARQSGAELIVRITADCPVIDPAVIDQVVAAFHAQAADFACNRLPPPAHRTWPIGLDTEVCAFSGLERAWKEAVLPYEREHVMPYFYDQPGRFKVVVVDHEPDYGALRWTVDTAEDLALLREIFSRFDGDDHFTWQDVRRLIEREPQLALINAGVRHKIGTETDERMGKK